MKYLIFSYELASLLAFLKSFIGILGTFIKLRTFFKQKDNFFKIRTMMKYSLKFSV